MNPARLLEQRRQGHVLHFQFPHGEQFQNLLDGSARIEGRERTRNSAPLISRRFSADIELEIEIGFCLERKSERRGDYMKSGKKKER